MGLLLLGVFQREGDEAAAVQASRLIQRLGLVTLALTLLLVVTITPRAARAAFGDMFVVDTFARFFKVLVLIAAGMSLLIALRTSWSGREMARFEFTGARPVRHPRHAADGLGQRPDRALSRPRAAESLALYVLAAFDRDDVRSTEAGLKYFVLGALASGHAALRQSRWSTASPARTDFARSHASVAGHGGERAGDGADRRPRLPDRRPRLQDRRRCRSTCGRRTSTKARRRRSPPSSRSRRSSRRWRCFVRVLIEPFGSLLAQWQQIIVFVSIASMILGALRRHRPDQHQAADGLQLDRPCRLRADRPRRRHAGRRARRADLHGRSTSS